MHRITRQCRRNAPLDTSPRRIGFGGITIRAPSLAGANQPFSAVQDIRMKPTHTRSGHFEPNRVRFRIVWLSVI